MKFEIGDEVVVSYGFHEKRHPGDPGINDDMLAMQGNKYIIKDRYMTSNGYETYYLENASWSWDGNWLEFANEMNDVEEEDILNVFG